jgi:hypothetical protein
MGLCQRIPRDQPLLAMRLSRQRFGANHILPECGIPVRGLGPENWTGGKVSSAVNP